MGMVVRTNTMALNAYRQLGMNNSAVAKSLEKLSSGFRINRAGDDAAGLAISEKMKAQIKGLETASANAQDGISLIQTAEGNLSEVHDMLNRMVELATKSANGTYTSQERSALQDEVDQLLEEIDRISQSANFNGTKLLDGTMGLNTEAFTGFSDVAAVKASDGKLTGADICAKETDGSTHIHFEAGTGVSPAKVKAEINCNMTFTVGAKTTAEATFTIAGNDYTIKLANTGADAADIDNATIAAALATAMRAGNMTYNTATGSAITAKTAAATAVTAGVKFGDGLFTLDDGSGKITLTYVGRFDAEGNFTAEEKFNGTKEQADSINAALGFDVELKELKKGSIKKGSVVHMTTNVTHAMPKPSVAVAGIDIDLTKVVGQGNTLTLDGVTFTFQTEKGEAPKDENGSAIAAATAGGGLIDVSDAKDLTEAIHMAADKLSQLGGTAITSTDTAVSGRTWKIGVNGDGTKIHLEQISAAASAVAADPKLLLDTYKKLTGIISAQIAPNAAANVGTKMDVDVAKITAGDSIRVDGKAYTFGDGAGQIALGENGEDALDNLKKALEADGYKAEVAEDGKSITVQSKDAKASTGPAVIGGGLTLQIGDTAEAFNKMNVSVANMSAKGLGLSGLEITSEVKASDAIARIKSAINDVSTTRAGMGALQNRLEHTINNLDVATENLSSANSRIRDTDMAKEMMNYTKMNVLVQSAQAMLAQANQQPQSVLQLLQ